MQLTELVQDVSTQFVEKKDLEARMKFATVLAEKYRFEQPEMVLFFTHPELSKKPISERCKTLGIVEEQYLVLLSQDGFKKFLKDFKDHNLTSLQTQSFEKLAKGIEQARMKYDKHGNATEDFSVELSLTSMAFPKADGATNVNVQINNLWERARAKAKQDVEVIEVSAKGD